MTQISLAEAYDDRSVIKKISDLDKRVEDLEAESTDVLTQRVAALESTSATHTSRISSNTTKISANTVEISSNTTKISSNSGKITTHDSEIASLKNRMTTAESGISAKQPKNLSFSYASITWSEDTTYTDLGYIYKAELPASGVTAAMTAQVTFDMVSAASGNVAPICETGANTITVWSKEALTDATADAVVFQ